MSKVAKKTILLSIQLLGELLIIKSNEISQETEIQVMCVYTEPVIRCLDIINSF